MSFILYLFLYIYIYILNVNDMKQGFQPEYIRVYVLFIVCCICAGFRICTLSELTVRPNHYCGYIFRVVLFVQLHHE